MFHLFTNRPLLVHLWLIGGVILFAGPTVSFKMGSQVATQASEKTAQCIAMTPKNPLYSSCIKELEQLVIQLVSTKELDLMNCWSDGYNGKAAWCLVWVWFQKRQVLVTNNNLVSYIKLPTSVKPNMYRLVNDVIKNQPKKSEMPSWSDFFRYKFDTAVDALNGWVDSDKTEGNIELNQAQEGVQMTSKAVKNDKVKGGDSFDKAVDNAERKVIEETERLAGTLKEQVKEARESAMDLIDQVEDFRIKTRNKLIRGVDKFVRKVDKTLEKADSMVDDIQDKVNDRIGVAKKHRERAENLAEELNEKTTNAMRGSIKDLRKKTAKLRNK